MGENNYRETELSGIPEAPDKGDQVPLPEHQVRLLQAHPMPVQMAAAERLLIFLLPCLRGFGSGLPAVVRGGPVRRILPKRRA